MIRSSYVLILLIIASLCSSAQQERLLPPSKSRTYNVEVDPSSFHTKVVTQRSEEIDLPFDQVGFSVFDVQPFEMLHESFAKERPDIKIYRITSQEDPTVSGKMMITPDYMSATIMTAQGITSLYPDQGQYMVEQGFDRAVKGHATCGHESHNLVDRRLLEEIRETASSRIGFSNGDTRRTFRLAVVATGEYYELNGASMAAVQNVLTSAVLDLDVLYEKELAINFSLLNPKIYDDKTTDPFDETSTLNRVQHARVGVKLNFPNVNSYDIGHVFHKSNTLVDDGWGSGGLASTPAVCQDQDNGDGPVKAGGWSGSFVTGNSFLRVAAHEFAHMFSANHTFNGEGQSCDSAIDDDTAYEIGSGTTLMSYAGICDDDQNVPESFLRDDYFHVHSLFQMVNYVQSLGDCPTNQVPLNNTAPQVTANSCGGEIRIPRGTPFYLNGSATDSENSNLQYTWEQYDEDGAGSRPTQGFIGSDASGSTIAPLFRSFPPTSASDRYFPTLAALANGADSDPFQAIPNVNRTMNFQLTVRDGNPEAGGVSSDEIQVEVMGTGPLRVQNVSSLTAGETSTITWSTNNSGDLCTTAKMLLSVDGGLTYPFTIASGLDYSSGQAQVTLPTQFPATDNGRVMLMCDDQECYSFFDVSDGTLTIDSECAAVSTLMCETTYEEFDQGEPALDLDLTAFSSQGFNAIITTIIPDQNTVIPIVTNDQGGVGCFETSSNLFARTERFIVTEAGEYRLDINFDVGNGIKYFSVHDGDTYDKDNPCPSFLQSNATSTGGSFNISSQLAVTLEACKEYVLTMQVNTSTYPVDVELTSISGPGDTQRILPDASADYAMTFIAVNENGIIEKASAASDFTTLIGGLYDLYAVSYKNGGAEPPLNVDPSSWEGQQLEAVQASSCMLISGNSKPILVDFTCRINDITAGTQTTCDPASNTYSQEVIVTYESPPPNGMLLVNGIQYEITTSPQTITITGQESNGQPVGVNASFTALQNCALFRDDLFVAPENCCEISFDLGGDRSLCSGEPVNLDAGSDGVRYQWFRNATLLEADTFATYEVVETGNYIVEVINDVGCSKTEVVNIVFFDTPTAEIEDDQVSACDGEIAIIQSTTTGQNLQWYKDDVALMGENSSSLIVMDAGIYKLEAINENQLSDGSILACSAEDEVEVSFVSRPVVDLGDDQIFCQGDPAFELNAGDDGTGYTWSRNTLVIMDETSSTLSVSQNGLYTVVVDKDGGCQTLDTVDVQFTELAEVFAGTDFNICQGESGELASFIEAERYEWYFNGVLFGDQSENPEVTEGGEYVLVGFNAFDCESRDTVVVTEVTPPMIDLGEDRVGCIGSAIELSIDSVGLIQWRRNNIPFSSNATVMITEAGTYSVAVQAASNCFGSDEIEVTFEPGPTLALGDDQRFCQGENYTIMAETNGNNIKWFKDENEIPGENTFELVVTESGVYSALVTGVSGCEVESMVAITVNALPSLQLGDDVVICDGEEATLMTIEPADSYEWTLGGAVVSNDPSFVTTEAGTYILTIVNEFGCSDSDMITVNANATPTLILDSEYQFCQGSGVTIVAESDATSFVWIVNETSVSETGNTIEITEAATVEVTASSSDGCTAEGVTQVISSETPTVDLGIDMEICPGNGITLDAGIHDSYLWSTGSTDPSIVVQSNVDEVTIQTVTVTVSNEAGCEGTDEIDITLLPIVVASVSQSASGVCNGQPVTLTASGGTGYLWIDDSGTLTDINGPSAIARPTETTTYQVLVSDNCPGNEDSETLVIEVFEANENIDAGDDDCAVNGNSITLNASGGVSYQWVADPSIQDGADSANPTVLPSEETVYFVDVTDDNGCIFRDSVTICLADDPLEFFELISIITPNGDGDNDVLRFVGLDAFPENNITIYNRWGYPVYQKKGYQQNGELFDGTNGGEELPPDTYYYVLEFNGEVYKSSITILR